MREAFVRVFAVALVGGCVVGDQESAPTLEQFREQFIGVDQAPDGTQKLFYDWDIPLHSDAEVAALYDAYVRAKYGGESISEATVNQTLLFTDDVWSATDRKDLAYCVSNAFGARKQAVVAAMASATGAWQTAAANALQYVYRPEHDASCTNANTAVKFDVVPGGANANGVIARAFFPGNARADREVVVFDAAFDPNPTFPFEGVLRHELGHTLGLRHETTRFEALVKFGPQCFENGFFRAVGAFDELSVMTTPACLGSAIKNKSLTISPLDGEGIRALYR